VVKDNLEKCWGNNNHQVGKYGTYFMQRENFLMGQNYRY
jgi:hypothetical protein